jgi:hypothetical protein
LNATEQEQYLIALRREKVQNLLCCGVPQTNISKALNIPLSTCHDDVVFLREHARNYFRTYDQHFAEEYKQVMDFLSVIMLEAWTAARQAKYERHKAPLLAVTKDCALAKAAMIWMLIPPPVAFIVYVHSYLQLDHLSDPRG